MSERIQTEGLLLHTRKKHHKRKYYRELLEFYNGAAQFHALSLVAVVFGQFSILAILSVVRQSPVAVGSLFVVYSIIFLGGGSYFFSQYLAFARRIRIIYCDKGMGEEYHELEKELEKRTSECVQDLYRGVFGRIILKVGTKDEKPLNDLLLHVVYWAISVLLFVMVWR